MRTFIWRVRNLGLKIALELYVIDFAKWFLKAKRVEISYWKISRRSDWKR